jgi:tRNA delta(2)-isopentenylpyrophosphate transferase
MIRDGLAGEVERLIEMGYDETLKPMRSFGYRHTVNCIKGMYDIEESVRLIKRDTRHYAKRQITWFRTDSEIEWFDPSDTDVVKTK